MGRRKKMAPLEGQGPYIIQSEPRRWAPQKDSRELTEPAHWYYALPGWSTSKKEATQFTSPSAAVTEISQLRRLIDHVEFTLVPIDGSIFFRTI